jgi:hypothetical protein
MDILQIPLNSDQHLDSIIFFSKKIGVFRVWKLEYRNLKRLLIQYPYLKTAYNSIHFCEVIPYIYFI